MNASAHCSSFALLLKRLPIVLYSPEQKIPGGAPSDVHQPVPLATEDEVLAAKLEQGKLTDGEQPEGFDQEPGDPGTQEPENNGADEERPGGAEEAEAAPQPIDIEAELVEVAEQRKLAESTRNNLSNQMKLSELRAEESKHWGPFMQAHDRLLFLADKIEKATAAEDIDDATRDAELRRLSKNLNDASQVFTQFQDLLQGELNKRGAKGERSPQFEAGKSKLAMDRQAREKERVRIYGEKDEQGVRRGGLLEQKRQAYEEAYKKDMADRSIFGRARLGLSKLFEGGEQGSKREWFRQMVRGEGQDVLDKRQELVAIQMEESKFVQNQARDPKSMQARMDMLIHRTETTRTRLLDEFGSADDEAREALCNKANLKGCDEAAYANYVHEMQDDRLKSLKDRLVHRLEGEDGLLRRMQFLKAANEYKQQARAEARAQDEVAEERPASVARDVWKWYTSLPRSKRIIGTSVVAGVATGGIAALAAPVGAAVGIGISATGLRVGRGFASAIIGGYTSRWVADSRNAKKEGREVDRNAIYEEARLAYARGDKRAYQQLMNNWTHWSANYDRATMMKAAAVGGITGLGSTSGALEVAGVQTMPGNAVRGIGSVFGSSSAEASELPPLSEQDKANLAEELITEANADPAKLDAFKEAINLIEGGYKDGGISMQSGGILSKEDVAWIRSAYVSEISESSTDVASSASAGEAAPVGITSEGSFSMAHIDANPNLAEAVDEAWATHELPPMPPDGVSREEFIQALELRFVEMLKEMRDGGGTTYDVLDPTDQKNMGLEVARLKAIEQATILINDGYRDDGISMQLEGVVSEEDVAWIRSAYLNEPYAGAPAAGAPAEATPGGTTMSTEEAEAKLHEELRIQDGAFTITIDNTESTFNEINYDKNPHFGENGSRHVYTTEYDGVGRGYLDVYHDAAAGTFTITPHFEYDYDDGTSKFTTDVDYKMEGVSPDNLDREVERIVNISFSEQSVRQFIMDGVAASREPSGAETSAEVLHAPAGISEYQVDLKEDLGDASVDTHKLLLWLDEEGDTSQTYTMATFDAGRAISVPTSSDDILTQVSYEASGVIDGSANDYLGLKVPGREDSILMSYREGVLYLSTRAADGTEMTDWNPVPVSEHATPESVRAMIGAYIAGEPIPTVSEPAVGAAETAEATAASEKSGAEAELTGESAIGESADVEVAEQHQQLAEMYEAVIRGENIDGTHIPETFDISYQGKDHTLVLDNDKVDLGPDSSTLAISYATADGSLKLTLVPDTSNDNQVIVTFGDTNTSEHISVAYEAGDTATIQSILDNKFGVTPKIPEELRPFEDIQGELAEPEMSEIEDSSEKDKALGDLIERLFTGKVDADATMVPSQFELMIGEDKHEFEPIGKIASFSITDTLKSMWSGLTNGDHESTTAYNAGNAMTYDTEDGKYRLMVQKLNDRLNIKLFDMEREEPDQKVFGTLYGEEDTKTIQEMIYNASKEILSEGKEKAEAAAGVVKAKAEAAAAAVGEKADTSYENLKKEVDTYMLKEYGDLRANIEKGSGPIPVFGEDYVQTVKSGDNIWNMVRAQMTGEPFDSMDESAKRVFLDTIDDHLQRATYQRDPFDKDLLVNMGFKPDANGNIDANKIFVGQEIDFRPLFESALNDGSTRDIIMEAFLNSVSEDWEIPNDAEHTRTERDMWGEPHPRESIPPIEYADERMLANDEAVLLTEGQESFVDKRAAAVTDYYEEYHHLTRESDFLGDPLYERTGEIPGGARLLMREFHLNSINGPSITEAGSLPDEGPISQRTHGLPQMFEKIAFIAHHNGMSIEDFRDEVMSGSMRDYSIEELVNEIVKQGGYLKMKDFGTWVQNLVPDGVEGDARLGVSQEQLAKMEYFFKNIDTKTYDNIDVDVMLNELPDNVSKSELSDVLYDEWDNFRAEHVHDSFIEWGPYIIAMHNDGEGFSMIRFDTPCMMHGDCDQDSMVKLSFEYDKI